MAADLRSDGPPYVDAFATFDSPLIIHTSIHTRELRGEGGAPLCGVYVMLVVAELARVDGHGDALAGYFPSALLEPAMVCVRGGRK